MALRIRHVDAIDAQIAAWTMQHDRRTLIERCQSAGIVCGPVNELADVMADPGVAARGLLSPLRHPLHGEVANAGVAEYPVRFGSIPTASRQAAPLLGQHTTEILEGLLGMPRAQADDLARRGIVRRHGREGEAAS
jgi:crotonobetainyl-CoA:carnitine CoA-transferase CaiB-like acyl-CoA transferase